MAFIQNLPAGVYERDQEGKGYYKVLVVGGKGAQSAEFNEIQQIQDSQRSKLAEAIFQGSTLLSGGFLSQEDSTKVISMAESKVYAQNYIFTIPASTVTPNTENGESTVGILLTKSYVTATEDSELKNPVPDTKNYGTEGAVRLKFTYRWSAEPSSVDDDTYYYPVYTTIDGIVYIEQQVNALNEVYETIQRYDNDSNGHYVVEGMNLQYNKDEEDYHVCEVSRGIAHVNGKEVIFNYSQPVNIRRALDVQTRISEPVSWSGNKVYYLRHNPIAEIQRIVGIKLASQIQMTHGTYNGCSDEVANTPLVEIVSISKDQAGTQKYTEGRDYFKDGDEINWSPNGTDADEPSPGSTYYVTYKYQTTDIFSTINSDKTGVTISGLVSGTTCYVDYTHYLKRVDSVTLTSDGNIEVVEGSSAEFNPSSREVTNNLTLSTVLVEYDKKPYFFNDYYRAYKNSDIAFLRDAIYDLQYNMAQLDLATDISSKDPSTTKAGMFTDPFYDDDQRDQGIEQNAEVADQTLYPKREWKIYPVRAGSDILLDRNSDVTVINQKYRTKVHSINEFNISNDTPVAFINCAPNTYRYIASTSTVTRTSYQYSNTVRSGNVISSSTSTQVSNSSGSWKVPSFQITVSGTNFNANETVRVYIAGTQVATFTANSVGEFSGVTNTPADMMSGTQQVKAIGAVSTAEAVTSISTTPQEQTHYITRTLSRGRAPVVVRDPIGQTFVNENDCFCSSVSLYFQRIPSKAVELKLMETTAGFPDPAKVLGSKVLQTGNIVLNDWTKFTFPSPVSLEANTHYALALFSDENNGTVYSAELGKRDDYNSFWVTKNVFPAGVMVQASQENTWTAIQTEDLTFQINKCSFKTGKFTKSLGTVTIPSTDPACQIYLLADSTVYAGTGIDYKIKLDSSTELEAISEYSIIDLNSNFTGTITVSADLTSTNANLSPVVSGDIQLAAATVVYPSTYVTRQFTTNGRYLKLYVDVLEFGTNQVTIQYQHTDDTWKDFDTDLTKYPNVNIGEGWVTKTYYKDLTTSGIGTRIKITFNDVTVSSVSLPGCRNLRVLTTSVAP